MMQVTDKRTLVRATVTIDEADVPQVEGFELDTEEWGRYASDELSADPEDAAVRRGYLFVFDVVMGDAYRVVVHDADVRAMGREEAADVWHQLWHGVHRLADDYFAASEVWSEVEDEDDEA